MTENKVEEDPNKVLKCFFDSEYFKNDPLMATRFKITLIETLNYAENCKYITDDLESLYSKLDQKYLDKLPFNYKDKIKKVKEGIQINQEFYNKLGSLYSPKFDYIGISRKDYEENHEFEAGLIRGFFMSCLLRDWTEEAKGEREHSYGQVLKELKKYYDFDDPNLNKKDIKILVPGSGCSRMAFEVARRGFDVEINDFCYIYIFCCDYLFNYSHKNEFKFCPRIHSFANSYTEASVYKRYSFPDENIREDLEKVGSKINFIKGDFLKLYKGKKDLFNVIITCFFIDVSQNIIEYVEIMHDLLKKGGLWINFGCLDYFFSRSFKSIDLTWDELRHVILQYDFDIKNEVKAFIPYGVKEGSTTSDSYGTVFFTAYKK